MAVYSATDQHHEAYPIGLTLEQPHVHIIMHPLDMLVPVSNNSFSYITAYKI